MPPPSAATHLKEVLDEPEISAVNFGTINVRRHLDPCILTLSEKRTRAVGQVQHDNRIRRLTEDIQTRARHVDQKPVQDRHPTCARSAGRSRTPTTAQA